MEKNKYPIVIIYMVLCIAITATGCSGNKDNDLNGLYKLSKEQIEEQNTADNPSEVYSEESADHETVQDASEDLGYPYDFFIVNDPVVGDMNYHYYYLDVDDPIVQERITDDDVSIWSRLFIKGLIGYTPQSDISGMLESYIKDTEIIVKEDEGLFQSERLAEVKEFILNMMMDIVRKRGENIEDYQKYFAEEAMLQQMEDYLKTELEEDWLLLESFYLSYYAGNAEEIVWKDEENGVTYRMAETDSYYNFSFLFYADYKTMNYGEENEAAVLAISCALSRETGLIEEIGMSKWYIIRKEFEIGRW